ncbi:MAG: alpha/beta hydrolase fold domain-containing protein, partial [Ginsengibacter sp.]
MVQPRGIFIKKLGFGIMISSFIFFSPVQNKKLKIWLIGDSTMANKEIKAYPETGWGMPFKYFFDSSVEVNNMAKNGRSTKTFMAEGLWQQALDKMEAGDYVMIQFGHNDEVPTKKSYTTPDEFKNNLEKYVTDSRSKNAIPVLITPVARRKFDSTGHIEETHAAYTQLVKDVASEYKVALIDLDSTSQQLFEQMGPENSKYLFNYTLLGENPNYPEGHKDDTHFNELGARRIAELVLAGIKELNLDLANRIVTPAKAKIASPSTAGITDIPDTSYTNYSAYISTKKSFPNIKLVREFNFPSVKQTRDIVYCTAGKRELKLDAFIPSDKKKQIPAIIIIHGGGWRTGNRTQHYPLAEKLSSLGYACFTPEYRLSTEALYPAAVFDIKSSIRWVHANAKKYNIDTSKIAVLGFSAGGQLAALTGTTNSNKKLNGDD